MSHSGPKEELFGLLPPEIQTRDKDIASALVECMDKHNIPPDKFVWISTDEQSFPEVFIELVITIINPFLGKALNRGQFKGFYLK